MLATLVPAELTHRQAVDDVLDDYPIQRRLDLRTNARPVRHRDMLSAKQRDRRHLVTLTELGSTDITPRRGSSHQYGPWDRTWTSLLRRS